MSLEPGQIIQQKYRIVKLLGEGGMGAVYEGLNEKIQRKVAIKVLHSGVSENKDAVQRFEREAKAAGTIGSDHIAEVLDMGEFPNGDRYMVMEFLDGETLSSRIEGKGRLTPQEAAQIVAQVLDGLGAAHNAGIIHRDLKPDNVFLLKTKAGRKDFVKILDFGISKFNQLSGDSQMSMTRTNAVLGTPYYMSPEQAKGSKNIDVRSDLYSVGVILYEAVTGQVPFNADTFNELIFKIVLETPPPPEQFVPNLDPGFGSIIRRAMTREPAQRFQNAQEFHDTLVQWMDGHAVPLFQDTATATRPSVVSMPDADAAAKTGFSAGQPATPAPWSGDSPSGDSLPQPPKTSGFLIGAAVLAAIATVVGLGVFVIGPMFSDKTTSSGTQTPSATATTTVSATAPAATSASPVASADPVPSASASAAVTASATSKPTSAPANPNANNPAVKPPAGKNPTGRPITTSL